jgi:mannose-6-phosphate isomerase class I
MEELLLRFDGVLKLQTEYVHRFYPDLDRMGQKRLKRSAREWIPERWIGSSVHAVNAPSLPGGGLSMLADARGPVALRDAIKAAPQTMLGPDLLAAHGPELRVLVKVLDPAEAIVFHLHATDEQVRRMPRNFRGHRFGKDEAYYFLDGIPKGPMPYTHVGLHAHVTRRELIDAVKRGPQHALELSPCLYQEYETGFFVPAGVPHRPGTALTLEIQQPADVNTFLETHAGGKRRPPEDLHPGFKSLDEAMELVEIDESRRVGMLTNHRLTPRVERRTSGGEIATIFPEDLCRKFAGRRVRVTRSITYREDSPLVLWVWRGRGTLNGRRIARGDEFFVAFEAARRGVELVNTGDERLELFTFFPLVQRGAKSNRTALPRVH